jgi:hypothetical protein
MPIRFRCVNCDKLLGIASRKAGTVVNCAQCGQPLIVPTPADTASASVAPVFSPAAPNPPAGSPSARPTAAKESAAPQRLFESQDFDRILEGDRTVRTDKAAASSAPAKVLAALAVDESDPDINVELVPVPRGFTLSTGFLIFLILIVLLLIGGAFTAGVVVGKRMIAE